ncbi:MAG: glycosyltransferase family 4 protein [Nitrospirae bacterium]|nr:glycosyltransferase family 4 protein [Nitrospirota bacterium]
MKILWFTWKDMEHPLAGGAELVNEEIGIRLARDGHEVVFLVAGFKGAVSETIRNGYKIIRVGNRYSVYYAAYRYYNKYLQGWADIVIDECNTVPFFCKFYVKERNFLFIDQLAREIWFHEMFFPINILGYLVEPVYLWLLRDRRVITISNSTKKDLLRYGFKNGNIAIISVGIDITPVEDINQMAKYDEPTILSIGYIRSMKRTHHIIMAFEIAKKDIKDLKLIIAGGYDSKYGKKVFELMQKSIYSSSIIYRGKVDKENKLELLRKCHLIAVTSVKEGWGLIVTEANSQGTPAVVYNVDGLKDSVIDKETGLICKKNSPSEMAEKMSELLINREIYYKFRHNAWQWSKEINFDRCYNDFKQTIENC